jgi:hypothetical protein
MKKKMQVENVNDQLLDQDMQQNEKIYGRPVSINQDLKHSASMGDEHSTLDEHEVQPNNNNRVLKY